MCTVRACPYVRELVRECIHACVRVRVCVGCAYDYDNKSLDTRLLRS